MTKREKSRLLDYIYIDENRLNRLFQQLPINAMLGGRFSWKIALSLTGAQLETSREPTSDLSNHEKIKRLINHLEKSDYLGKTRPKNYSDKKPFVLETMEARKLVVSSSYVEKLSGIKEFAVWISDPFEEDLSNEAFNWNGCFTYLTQLHMDDEEQTYMWSGCSALQALSNLALGVNLPFQQGANEEPLGRGSAEHPISKLEKLGWRVTDKRRITSLYRIRYMTNEQFYEVNSERHRVHDLLGYPIFIADYL